MGEFALHKKDHLIPREGFERLLSILDEDREQAGRKYEQIRAKLSFFFKKHGCWDSDERTDKTLNRVARRLAEGEVIHNLSAYCFGVARNVLRERGDETGHLVMDDLPKKQEPSTDPREEERRSDEWFVEQRAIRCMQKCLQALSEADRELITEYCQAETIARRQQLASRLGVNLGSLRVRVHRIRERLRACHQGCLDA